MGTLRVMDQSGDTKLTWNAESIPEITEARKKFNEYMAVMVGKVKKYKAYKVEDISGKKVGEEITEFDPNIERLVLVPQMVGG